jgi:hypothetical protein
VSAAEALAALCHVRCLDLRVIQGPSRKTEHVRLRDWLANELASAGFNQSEIARAMLKHPSSVWSRLNGGKSSKPARAIGQPDVFCSCCYQRRRAA